MSEELLPRIGYYIMFKKSSLKLFRVSGAAGIELKTEGLWNGFEKEGGCSYSSGSFNYNVGGAKLAPPNPLVKILRKLPPVLLED
jgi:hypothetical protein